MFQKNYEKHDGIITNTSAIVSIIIPLYNGQKYIEEHIISLINQTYKNIEIIVVDNNSDDASVQIVTSLIKKGYPITILKNEQNLGFCIAVNQGFENSTGKYILISSQDRSYEPNWIYETVNKMETDSKIGIVFSKVYWNNRTIGYFGLAYDYYGMGILRNSPYEKDLFYSGGAILVRTSAVEKIGLFDPEFFMYQDDVDLCWKVRLLGLKISMIENAVCYDLGRSIDVSWQGGKLHISLDPEFINMPTYIFYHNSKNRIRIALKNYSGVNVFKRVPIIVVLIFLRGIFQSIAARRSSYFFLSLKALWWNVIHFQNTLTYRKKIQKLRLVSDKEIEKYMIRKSVELSSAIPMLKLLFQKREKN